MKKFFQKNKIIILLIIIIFLSVIWYCQKYNLSFASIYQKSCQILRVKQ